MLVSFLVLNFLLIIWLLLIYSSIYSFFCLTGPHWISLFVKWAPCTQIFIITIIIITEVGSHAYIRAPLLEPKRGGNTAVRRMLRRRGSCTLFQNGQPVVNSSLALDSIVTWYAQSTSYWKPLLWRLLVPPQSVSREFFCVCKAVR